MGKWAARRNRAPTAAWSARFYVSFIRLIIILSLIGHRWN